MSADTLEWDDRFSEDSIESSTRVVHEAADTLSATMEHDVLEAITEKDPEGVVDTINRYICFLGRFDLEIVQPAYAYLDRHESVEDFSSDPNAENVVMLLKGTGLAKYKEVSMPAFQRFQLVCPETCSTLRESLRQHEGGFYSLPWEDRADVVTAYQIMRLMVDENDPHVAGDGYYLKR